MGKPKNLPALAPDTGTDAAQPTPAPAPAPAQDDGETTVTITKAARAKHELLDASGAVVEDEEKATGIRYTLLANNQTFDWQSGLAAGTPATMIAVFGAKTLATNETSAARNNAKGGASPDEQMQAVRDRFALVDGGQWVDRTREGVGARVDKDALAEAICRVKIAAGAKAKDGTQFTDETVAAGLKAKVRQMLEDDANLVRTARQVPDVAQAYAAIVGRQTKSIDDLGI